MNQPKTQGPKPLTEKQTLLLQHSHLSAEKEALMPYNDYEEVEEETRDLTARMHQIMERVKEIDNG